MAEQSWRDAAYDDSTNDKSPPDDEKDVELPSIERLEVQSIQSHDTTTTLQVLKDHIQRSRPSISSANAPIYGSSAAQPNVPSLQQLETSSPTLLSRPETYYDGGSQFEAEFLKQQWGLLMETRHSFSKPLEEELEGAMVTKAGIDGGKEFLPCTALARILRRENVEELLRQRDPNLSDDPVKLSWKISPPPDSLDSYRKVLAILLLTDKDLLAYLHNFLDERISDRFLPLERTEDDNLRHSSHDRALEFAKSWTLKQKKDFCRRQWEVSPVFFGGNQKGVVHYECPDGKILPFTMADEPQMPASNSEVHGATTQRAGPKIRMGGNGDVSIHQIHEDQQDLERYTTDGPRRAVAVKVLKSGDKNDFDKERDMLVRLSRNESPHLAKLLATFETQCDTGKLSNRRYHLMFECAQCNLQDLWMQGHQTSDRTELAKWVAMQCNGLAQALSIIHDFKQHRGQDDPNPRTHGFHGDIKPENILVYWGWRGTNNRLGVLQITDFGLSSFHYTATAIDIKAKLVDHHYRPPESELVFEISQSLDIWTLGCLFLEFLTWLLMGPKGQDLFATKRLTPNLMRNNIREVYFYKMEKKAGEVRVTLKDEVLKWVADLCKHKDKSQFVSDLSEIVIKYMLLVELPQTITGMSNSSTRRRITADKLASAIHECVESGEVHASDYYTRTRRFFDPRKGSIDIPIVSIRQTVEEIESGMRKRTSSHPGC